MTTRRSVLRLAGGAAGLAVLAGCTSRTAAQTDRPRATKQDLLFVATAGGLSVLESGTGRAILPAPAWMATADWTRVVTAEPDGAGIRLVTRDTRSGRVMSGGSLRDRLEPRVVSPDGRLVALATPGGAGATIYRPAARLQTTIVVADSGGERARFTLPGNLEPEAFSATGDVLYVLDYLPPDKPDRYRVRTLDLTSGQVAPLVNKSAVAISPGAEETMRGQGRQAVYDGRRKFLFTLYTHQPDHEHTRDLLAGGVRPGSPHVHAFVHSLSLDGGFAFCIDLPSPFGEGPAAGHAITLRPDGSRLHVLDARTGSLAHIDPESLSVARVTTFTEPGMPGDATAVSTADGGLVVGAGTTVVTVPVDVSSTAPKRSLSTGGQVRGFALTDQRLYVGQEDTVVVYDRGSGEALDRLAVPGLVAVRHAIAP